MTDTTLFLGAVALVVTVFIVLKFGKTILRGLALVGLLALLSVSLLLYARLGDGPVGIEAVQALDVSAQPTSIPQPTTTPKPNKGWLDALSDVAAVVRVLKPDQKSESEPAVVIPTPYVIRQPAARSNTFGTFCAGAFAMIALGALGVAGWFYWQWKEGNDPHAPFSRRWEAKQRQPEPNPQPQPQQWQQPAVYWQPQDDPGQFNPQDWGW